MNTSDQFNQVISAALARIFRPLFRVLLRNSLSFNDFVDIAKRCYVEVAMQDFAIPGKKPSISRVSILSGLTRKEIQRILTDRPSGSEPPLEGYNRAARVIAGWVRDPEFLDPAGYPRALSFQDGSPSFSELVRRHSGDVPARAVLDELLRVGAVERAPDGSIRLVARSYIPRTSALDKLEILGTDVADLVATIDHNLEHGDRAPRFQRKVMYDNVPDEAIEKFREMSGAQAQAILEQLDRWLAGHDRDSNQEVKGTGRNRVGIGIYYIEENMTPVSKE